jgi:hypothetical protein
MSNKLVGKRRTQVDMSIRSIGVFDAVASALKRKRDTLKLGTGSVAGQVCDYVASDISLLKKIFNEIPPNDPDWSGIEIRINEHNKSAK